MIVTSINDKFVVKTRKKNSWKMIAPLGKTQVTSDVDMYKYC